MLSILFYIFFSVITLVYFLIFGLVFFVTFAFDRNRRVMHAMSRVWARACFCVVPRRRMVVEGLENIDKREAYVVVANHRSMLDILLFYVVPLEFKWVSKREVYKWPLFGWVLRMHGDITIERGTTSGVNKMIKEATRWLSRGVSVVIFPEGSRGKTPHVGRFKEGAFVMAKRAGVGVLPCVMDGTSTAFKGWRFNFRNKYHVRVLPPLSAQIVAQSDVRELTQQMQQLIAEEYEQIKSDKKIGELR